MAKYSYCYKGSSEYIYTVYVENKSKAIEFFAKLKILEIDKFNQLYEVIERKNSKDN
jgi:hypothetical protein